MMMNGSNQVPIDALNNTITGVGLRKPGTSHNKMNKRNLTLASGGLASGSQETAATLAVKRPGTTQGTSNATLGATSNRMSRYRRVQGSGHPTRNLNVLSQGLPPAEFEI